MTYEQTMNRINAKRGAFRAVCWERPLKTRKNVRDIVVKRTYGTGLRFGVCYDNMASTQKAREDGTLPAENQGLRGREWIIPNLTLRSLRTGNTLVRLSLAQNSTFNTEYFLNGRKVEKAEIEPLVLKSEVASHEMPNVFDLATDHIIAIV